MSTKVLLVQPNYFYQRKSGAWGVNPPLGLAYIAAVLEQNNIPVEILDANALNLSSSKVVNYIKKTSPSIVGISILTPVHQYCLDIVQKLPKNIISVAGGNQATALPEDLLKKGFQIIVQGEGENTFLEIAQGKEISKIQGISYLKNNHVETNPARPPLDVNEIPFPARHLLIANGVNLPYKSADTQYFPWAGILTSRGCPYDCYYCFKKTFGYQVRQRSVENVINEIVFLKENYKVKEIDIYDDLFNFDLKRAEAILDEIIKRDLNIKIRCSNGLRVDKINPDFLAKMKKAGCIYIAFGVESGDQTVLDKIPKHITIEQIKSAVKMTKKIGITTSGFFIFGLLGDNKKTMQKTINLAKELDLDLTSFTIATPYPGTKLWKHVKFKGKLFVTNWEDFHHSTGKMIFTSPEVPEPKDVEQMYRKAYFQFYFRPKYVLKQLFKIRSFLQLKNLLFGAMAVLKTIKK
jgi:anaerobic magnesium-protoporphyrin IX monomethyl ester cyclase